MVYPAIASWIELKEYMKNKELKHCTSACDLALQNKNTKRRREELCWGDMCVCSSVYHSDSIVACTTFYDFFYSRVNAKSYNSPYLFYFKRTYFKLINKQKKVTSSNLSMSTTHFFLNCRKFSFFISDAEGLKLNRNIHKEKNLHGRS